MDRLEILRQEINKIDREIMKLLDRRFEIAREIGKIKLDMGMDIYDPRREEEILSKVGKYRKIYREILSFSKMEQRRVISESIPNIGFKIGIVGYGRMGSLFANIFRRYFEKVVIYDIKDIEELPEDITKSNDLKELIGEVDLIMVSTPLTTIHNTVKEIREIMSDMNIANKIVFDIATIKYRVVPELMKFPSGIGVATLHPMFGPNIESHIGEKMLIMGIPGREEYVAKLLDIFSRIGFHMVETDYMIHDLYIIYTIGIPYLLGYTYEKLLKPLGEEIEIFGGPSYRLFKDYYRRISGDGEEFIHFILGHPLGKRIVERLVDIIWSTSGLE